MYSSMQLMIKLGNVQALGILHHSPVITNIGDVSRANNMNLLEFLSNPTITSPFFFLFLSFFVSTLYLALV